MLVEMVAGGELLLLEGEMAGFDGVHVVLQVGHRPVALTGIVAVGRWSESEVGFALPVRCVVPGTIAGKGKIRQLVLLHAFFTCKPNKGLELAEAFLLIQLLELTLFLHASEGGAGLDGEVVGGEVVYWIREDG